MINESFVLFAKITPLIIQLVCAAAGMQSRRMRDILRRRLDLCPSLASQLDHQTFTTERRRHNWIRRRLNSLPCLTWFSTETTRIQSTLGLVITLITSMWLSENAFFIVISSLAFAAIIGIYAVYIDNETDPAFDRRGLYYAVACTFVGCWFIYASTLP